MAIYNYDALNEEYDDTNDKILDSMLETCSAMLNMMDESTALQRHYGLTQKNMRESDKATREILDSSKTGRLMNKASDKYFSSKSAGEHMAAKAGKAYHSGEVDNRVDKLYSGKGIEGKMMKSVTSDMSDRDKENNKDISKAAARAATGYSLTKAAQSGADVKGSYDKAAEKAEKKKAIKETCLYILSTIDDM